MKITVSEIENSKENNLTKHFSEIINEFNKEVPVRADLVFENLGMLIRVKGKIHAEVNLICDLCLKEFTKVFDINVDEAYSKNSLNDNPKEEYELKENCFVEDLNGEDEIDITDFVYQCVILNIPNKLVCDINCSGDEKLQKYIKTEITDPRLEIFKTIKIEKDN